MKKISLMVACAGIISAATFANGRQAINNLQEGSRVQKTEKAQPASTPKKQKAEPGVQKAETIPQKAEVKQKAEPEKATQTAPPTNNPVKKAAAAKQEMKIDPTAIEQPKK